MTRSFGRRCPTSLASVARRVATSSTPGTSRAATAAPGGIGEKPSLFWITRSPWKVSSTASAIELLRPAAKTVTKATRARPIISAAAVIAVRPGLRCAFSRARRPVRRRRRSSGQPAIAASGGTRRGLKSETPSTIDDRADAHQAGGGVAVGAAEEAEQQHRQADRAEQGGEGDVEERRRRRLVLGT